jgi:hypothetical protein
VAGDHCLCDPLGAVDLGAFAPEGGWGDAPFRTVILALVVAGTAHAFLLRGRVFDPVANGDQDASTGLLLLPSGCCCWASSSCSLVRTTYAHDLMEYLRLPRRPAGAPTGG